MKAYVMLHGQTDFDVEGRIIGTNDPVLNDTGKEQARAAVSSLQGKDINMILSSPQLRTMETAEIVAEGLGLDKGKITKGLKLYERAFGELEGKKIEEVDMFVLTDWFSNVAPPDGEPLKKTVDRVVAYMNNMVKLFRTKTMLLVVPEHVLRVLFWFFNGLPQPGQNSAIEIEYCRVYEFDTENIPPEIKDYSPDAVMPGGAPAEQPQDDPGRLLSQEEIDALIAELTAGK